MTINITEHYKEAKPSENKYLYLDGEIFEGVCCPLSVNPEETYAEVTSEEAIELINKYVEDNGIDKEKVTIDTLFD